jgi:hypothetical protein
MDGAGHLRTLVSIVIPMAQPAIVTMALLSLVAKWNDFLWPLIVTNTANIRTLPISPQFFSNSAPSPTLPRWRMESGASPPNGSGADRIAGRVRAIGHRDALEALTPNPSPSGSGERRVRERSSAGEVVWAHMFCPPLNPQRGETGRGVEMPRNVLYRLLRV